jgi:hypothetical protein
VKNRKNVLCDKGLDARALEPVSRVPGVQQAAFAWGVPLTGNSWL